MSLKHKLNIYMTPQSREREGMALPYPLERDTRRPVPKIEEILSSCRPAGSKTEKKFIREFLDVVPGMQIDGIGNRYIVVGDKPPLVMFSCHTDTVHTHGGPQHLVVDSHMKHIWADDSSCLGADDGAGIFICLTLIDAGVPGLYVFHRQEEIGGHGSRHFFQHEHDGLLSDVRYCVAFDRKGTQDIITHQGMERTASNEFAHALARELGMNHAPSDMGTFTDSANYADGVSECTNVAVGYERAHTVHEYLDYGYLHDVTHALLGVNWNTLPHIRTPGDKGREEYFSGTNDPSSSQSMDDVYVCADYMGYTEILKMCHDSPRTAATVLAHLGITYEDVLEATGLDEHDTVEDAIIQVERGYN